MPWQFWRRPNPRERARLEQVRAQAQAVLTQLAASGESQQYLVTLQPFLDYAPEVLALGPVPCSLTQQVLYGLGTFQGAHYHRFRENLREDFKTTAPTLRAVRRSGLVAFDDQQLPYITPKGQQLFQAIQEAGGYPITRQRPIAASKDAR
ncbi:MAG: hypothetical protein M1396_01405 [Chloroflexi bacterium]|nr:hypothetical protein [Chloroflexota bacterium]